jgi:hypothetical protein
MMVGLPKLPLAEAVPVRLALSIAHDVLARAVRELGEDDPEETCRQQWRLALENLAERVEGLRRLVSAQ